MGYDTEFEGRFKLNKKLTDHLYSTLLKFSEKRHENYEKTNMPGLYCHWKPSGDMFGIEWNGSEKFYSYVNWLLYLIDNFLKPFEYRLNGKVYYRGEDFWDMGYIEVIDNEIKIHTFRSELTDSDIEKWENVEE